MAGTTSHGTINKYPQLDNVMQLILDKTNERKDYFLLKFMKEKQLVKHSENIVQVFITLTRLFLFYQKQVVVFRLFW